jgi:hypothetical protein
MTSMPPLLPDGENIDCPFQANGRGSIICKCAVTSGNCTNEASELICYKCDAGKIFREVGCDAFTAKIYLAEGCSDTIHIESILCTKRRRQTTLDHCRSCTIVTAPTTKEIISATRELFHSQEFYSAYKNLEDARIGLRDGDYDGAIRSSVSCLESVIKTILDKKELKYPANKSVHSLWKAVKDPLQLDTVVPTDTTTALIGTLSGAVLHLGGMRNQISDAHGKGEVSPEVPYMLAELAINSASTLATLLVRRYIQIRGE